MPNAQRIVVLDTETTGLDPTTNRIIEFGAIEIVDRRVSDRVVHFYINPQQDVGEDITEITGLTNSDLSDKPVFSEVAEQIVEFVRGAEIIAHNASFDMSFLDIELARCGYTDRMASLAAGVIDTLALARQKHPGARNSLDALCDRYDVDRGTRKVHGALLDASLLANVYLAMTSEQSALKLDGGGAIASGGSAFAKLAAQEAGRPLPVLRPSPDELQAHAAKIEAIAAAAGPASQALRLK